MAKVRNQGKLNKKRQLRYLLFRYFWSLLPKFISRKEARYQVVSPSNFEICLTFPNFLWLWFLSRSATREATRIQSSLYYISSPAYLWRIKSVLKHRKRLKYYDQHCLQKNLYFTSLKVVSLTFLPACF